MPPDKTPSSSQRENSGRGHASGAVAHDLDDNTSAKPASTNHTNDEKPRREERGRRSSSPLQEKLSKNRKRPSSADDRQEKKRIRSQDESPDKGAIRSEDVQRRSSGSTKPVARSTKPNSGVLAMLIRDQVRTNDRMDRVELERATVAFERVDTSGRRVRLMTEYLTGNEEAP